MLYFRLHAPSDDAHRSLTLVYHPLPDAVLRHLHLQELCPHALDLLLRRGPDVEGPDDGAHVLGHLDGREARHAHLEHKYLGGGTCEQRGDERGRGSSTART